jgi:hypothetical protein
MRSPADMTVIQIDITNACTKRCANCTRFCGHHAKPFFMDFETFKTALASMEGFPGVVGIMGGEPTIHPEFEAFVLYFAETFGTTRDNRPMTVPAADFIGHITANSFDFRIGASNQRGLWSSISRKYYAHFELIQDVFGLQCLNDHTSESQHTTLMCTRKELGIGDEEWFKLRDACWVQNNWSAAITPKGAFFCEVAAALDMTFDGPGGWKVEPGWWKRTPDAFGEQLNWCERCSACLPVPKRNANDETDDVSPYYLEELQRMKSKKIRNDLVTTFDPAGLRDEGHAVTQGSQPYLGDNASRIGAATEVLPPHEISFLRPDEAIPDKAEDWVAVLINQSGWVESEITALAGTYVFNPGCMYALLDAHGQIAAWFFNTMARSLRGVAYRGQAFSQSLPAAYPAAKLVGIHLPNAPRASSPATRVAEPA